MKRLVLMVCATALLAACGTASGSGSNKAEKAVRERADYWQRGDDVSALYMTGPKAQHLLNQDIASCVAETRELVRLGSIRQAEPPPGVGMSPGLRAGWNSPTRDGPLYTEFTQFQDFDGCMKVKGWDRVDYVKPITADRAAANYNHTILGYIPGFSSSSSDSRDETQTGQFNK